MQSHAGPCLTDYLTHWLFRIFSRSQHDSGEVDLAQKESQIWTPQRQLPLSLLSIRQKLKILKLAMLELPPFEWMAKYAHGKMGTSTIATKFVLK